jgi:lactate dehydrogenase-like 2-hydroxyacid dehydrogenase
MVGKQVTGARLGIIGMGRVGQAFARKARGFDMEIHYYNRTRLAPHQELGATYHDTIESLLAECLTSCRCTARRRPKQPA